MHAISSHKLSACTLLASLFISACSNSSSVERNPDGSSPTPTPTSQASASPTPTTTPAPTGLPQPSGSPAPTQSPPVQIGGSTIKVLSNRADLINGGDVLLQVIPAQGVDPESLALSLNGNDVSDAFGLSADGRYLGLVKGLDIGDNTFSASLGAVSNSVNIRNFPQGGPVFAGPQLTPWNCRNEDAVDEQCNQAPVYSWYYLPDGGDELVSYDINSPPADVASVTTETGETVPFIVRQETGYQDRDQYKIATIYQPEQPWTALTPQPQFNGKLLITHGSSCGVDYETGGAPSVLRYTPTDFASEDIPSTGDDSVVYALGQGFAIMSTALNNAGHNCDLPLQAESMVMAKEHLIEQYGTLRYTIGTGCSGGSLTAQWVANAYPGIYQGILPTCSFPDAWSTATQFVDYHGLLIYFGINDFESFPPDYLDFTDADRIPWLPTQMADVMGHVTVVNAEVSEMAQFHVAVPDNRDGCGGVNDEELYHPSDNPDGVRCSIVDASINVFGPRSPEDWLAPEVAAGRGFAGFPLDNVGVQYGLQALQEAKISPQQFIDLNQKIGGLDIDTKLIAERTPASQPALENAYRSGMINVANNLNRTAIIDCRGPDPGLFHDSYRTFALRDRLDKAHGNHDNQVVWGGPVPIIGDTQCALNSLIAMDEWLAAVEADDSESPIADKLTANKPADLTDACWDGMGLQQAPVLCPQAALTVYGTPRTVAGDAIATYTNKCQLKAIDEADYVPHVNGTPVPGAPPLITADQLADIFPDGVCDFSKPGVSFQGNVPWMSYADELGDVVYGGAPMPATPENSGEGWMSENFGGF